MRFRDFKGNSETVAPLREMLQRERFPQAVILSGPEGSGKYTLALLMAQAMNCLTPVVADGLPEGCGACSNCLRIADSFDLDARVAEAIEVREAMKDVDKKETRIMVQTHPEVLIVPPDPPQMMIKVGQVRRVIETIYFRPGEARRRVYIFTEATFMKEAANSLLKILEEPPDFATLFLLAKGPGELLPTIRSRCMMLALAPLCGKEIEQHLATTHPEWGARERALVARLCGGAIGKAQSFDLPGYLARRKDALLLLGTAIHEDHTALFRATETYRPGADGREQMDLLIRTLYSLLEDLTFLRSGTPDLVRNTDVLGELKKLADAASFDWIVYATRELAALERGMRRNLLRSLALDAFAVSLEH